MKLCIVYGKIWITIGEWRMVNGIRACIVSLGCPKNLVDSELMLGKLKNAGYKISIDPEEAEIIVVNTCGFIESAKAEAIETILDVAKYKEKSCQVLIVTGCLAQRYKEEIIKELPEVDFVLGTGNYKDITCAIECVLNGKEECESRILCSLPTDISYLNEERVVSTPKTHAYLKIAEGCDNKCAYCVIPYLRGSFISRRKEDVLEEARLLIEAEYREIILVAQDTTRYGYDLYGKPKLAELLTNICRIDGDFRIRILYCYPELITDELIDVIAKEKKICKYIDMPVQHGSDRILKLMGRRSLSGEIREKISKLREKIPEIYIRTSLIVGFPGESEKDFESLKSFVEEVRFDRLGIFEYSREEGTKAAEMKEQVSEKIKKNRMNCIMKIQQSITWEISGKRLGKEYDVVVEGISDDGIFFWGRTYAEAPEIDGTIYFTALREIESGEVVKVKILNIDEYDLIGEQLI